MKDDFFRPIYLRLPTENVVFLKFLLETYEGIGELRTLDNDKGLVVILALTDTKEIVEKMLASEKTSLKWEYTTDIPDLKNDWLMLS